MKSFLSFILIGLLILCSTAFAFIRLTSPKFAEQTVRQVKLYENASGQLEKLLPDDISRDLPISKPQLASIITGAVDSKTFYGFTDAAIDGYLPWLTGRSQVINFSYDLSSLKEQLKLSAEKQLLTQYQQLPPCKKGYRVTTGFPQCQLPTGSVNIDAQISSALNPTFDKLPGQFTPPAPNQGLQQARTNISRAYKVAEIILAATAIYLLLFLLLFRAKAFGAIAVSFIVVGLFEYVFSYFGPSIMKAVIATIIERTSSSVSLDTTINIIGPVVGILASVFKTFALGCLIIGAILLLLSVFRHFRKLAPIP